MSQIPIRGGSAKSHAEYVYERHCSLSDEVKSLSYRVSDFLQRLSRIENLLHLGANVRENALIKRAYERGLADQQNKENQHDQV